MGGAPQQSNAVAISQINLQQSSNAAAVPVVYGTARIPANIIDYGDFKATPHNSNSSSGGKGGESSNGSVSYTYSAYLLMGLCEGDNTTPIGVRTIWRDKAKFVTDGTSSACAKAKMTLFGGAEGQAAWGYLTTNHPSKAMSYTGTAYVAASAYALDSGAGLANHNFEVQAKFIFGSGIDDANPAVIIPDYLDSSRYGIAFPSSSIGNLTQYSNYCVAAGLFVSPAWTSTQTASQSLDDLMTVTNSALIWSEGLMKIIPYGDQALTGNGATFTPNVTPLYDLTDDDFLPNGDSPVQINRTSPADRDNCFTMQILDRANDYNEVVLTTQDQSYIDRYLLRQADQLSYNMICTQAIGRLSLELYKQRNLYTPAQYTFILGWKYALLEPMDIVTITDVTLGLNKSPMRILSTKESSLAITFTVEDFPAGAGHATLYASASSAGTVADYNASPGAVTQPMFIEMPKSYSSTGLSIGVAVSGSQTNWGGAEVWGSTDGTTYKLLGTNSGGARYGTLTASMPSSAGSAAVTLAGLGGQILASSPNDAALLNSLCAVDSEFLTYQTATLTGTNAYTLGTLGRGLTGSLAATHSVSAPFARIDDAIVQSGDLDQSYIGQTLYFKFLSFNVYGGGKQALSDVSPYTYVVSGVQALSAAAGPTNLAASVTSAGVGLTWTLPKASSGGFTTVVERAPDVSGLPGTFAGIANVLGSGSTYTDPKTDGSVQHYRVRCVDSSGNFTAYSSQVVVTCTAGSSGTTSSAMSISFNPSAPYNYRTSGASVAVTASVSGGTGPFTYAWTHVSGDSLTKTNTTTAVCTFTNPIANTDKTELAQCTVTDSTSATVTAQISVECENDSSGTAPKGGYTP